MNIGIQNENPLHAALKTWYARPGDLLEVERDGYVIDIIQDGRLVEIQTANFSAIKDKLFDLTTRYPLRLVYPIAQEKWIVKLPVGSAGPSRKRKSPKRGRPAEIFKEWVSFPDLLRHPNFSLEVLMIREEEIRRYIGQRRWRKQGWGIEERRLLGVVKQHLFESPQDMLDLIPPGAPDPFTTLELATALDQPRWLAQKAAYCLRKMDLIEQIGKRDRANLYTFKPPVGV